MKTERLYAFVGCLTLFATLLIADAKSVGLVTGPFVDHPAGHPLDGRTSSVWRLKVGTWGENLAEETLRLRGFNEILEVKNGSNNGIDRIAIKRGSTGEILDVRFVEVKSSRAAKPKLAYTRYGGTQMSRKWLASNISMMRNSGDPALKKLAREFSVFRKASGRTIESFGELIHVNTRTGMLTGYSADGRSIRYSESLGRLLKNLQLKARNPHVHIWATRTLSQWDSIRSTSMSTWLGKNVSQQSTKSILASSAQGFAVKRIAVLRQSRVALVTKVMLRSAGRIAFVVALAMDAKELFDTEYSYRTGAISARQRNMQLASKAGGIGGAAAGAWAGGVTGAWLGGFGGPVAWLTVPAGGIVGAAIGGVSGYIGGSAVAGYGATAWYNSIDVAVRNKVELAWLGSNYTEL